MKTQARWLLCIAVVLLCATAAVAEKTTTRLSIVPQGKTLDPADTQAPTITLISPEVKRGVKLETAGESVTVAGRAEDASGVASVVVNGQAAALDEDGNFSADILLKVGENSIVVTATDIYKNTAAERFTIVRKAGQAVSAAGARKQPAAGGDIAIAGNRQGLRPGHRDQQL